MSNIIWNAAQRQAIEFSGKSLLLSAAAGSGKTATLTERIITLLKKPASEAELSRMLIVTFTTDATGELRQRIGAALTSAIAENPTDRRLVRQLQSLDTAEISTIHSFLLKELKPYFLKLSLPPDFSVADSASLAELKKEIMLDTVNDYFDGRCNCDNFTLLADALSGARDGESLDTALLSLWGKLVTLGLGADYLLHDNIEDDFLLSNAGKPVLESIKVCSEHYQKAFTMLANELELHEDTQKYSEGALSSSELAEQLYIKSKDGYSSVREFLSSFSLPRLAPLKIEKQTEEYVIYKDIRSDFSKELKDLLRNYFTPSVAEINETVKTNRLVCRAASEVISEFERRFAESKRERGKVDFVDIERFAVSVFCNEDKTPTAEALTVGEKYDYIFIDEYQDTNRLQDMVFSAISTHASRFMVGDVKQSIYGFRGAYPDIFCDYREKYENGDGGTAVFMSENHRSDSGVIDFSNLVSEYMFPSSSTPFEKEDRLVCAKSGGENGTPAEICLVEPGETEYPNHEAEYIAKRIKTMLSGETLKSGDRIKAGDIAILMRSGAAAGDFKDALQRHGIAVKNSAVESFFNYSEVLLALSLLCAVDNPSTDIYLAGAMKSPLFGFTLDDLVRLRQNDKTPLWYSVNKYAENNNDELALRLRAFITRLDSYRTAARSMSADKMLYMLISDTGFLWLRDDSGTGRLRRSVKTLFSHAISIGRQGAGLHELILYLRGLMKENDIKEPDSGADAVTLISVHRSKGLEYPVCFLCDNTRSFNFRDIYASAQLDPENGLFLKLPDPGGLIKCDNPLRISASLGAKQRSLEEEMRVLYVALTRARERLIVTLKTGDAQKELEDSRKRIFFGTDKYTVQNVYSSGMLMLDAVNSTPADPCFTLKTVNPDVAPVIESDAVIIEESSVDVEKTEQILKERFAFTYPKPFLSDIPAKLPVSKLSSTVLDTDGYEKAAAVKKPAFMETDKKPDPSAAGTATHLFLQFCDFNRLLADGAATEAKRLADNSFITGDDGELIRLDEIDLFTKSSLFKRMLGAKKIYRELRFNSLVPASQFTEQAELARELEADGTKICVQGVVDCLFTDKNGKTVLVDYKTDRLTEAELADVSLAADKLTKRHRDQLLMYRRICSEMTGSDIDEVLIYSLPLGDAIELTGE